MIARKAAEKRWKKPSLERPEIPKEYLQLVNKTFELQSLLYDLNILPECLVSFEMTQEHLRTYRMFFLICDHFNAIIERFNKIKIDLLKEQAITRLRKRLDDNKDDIHKEMWHIGFDTTNLREIEAKLQKQLKRIENDEDPIIVFMDS